MRNDATVINPNRKSAAERRAWLVRSVQLALVMLVAVSPGYVVAQTTESPADYFHAGARDFIGNKLTDAAQSVDYGLSLAPDDAELLQLKNLIDAALEEQKKQQQNQQDQQDQQDQQQQDQEQDQQQQDQQQEEQDGGEESDQQEQDPQNQEEQQEGEEQSDEQKQGNEQESDSQGGGDSETDPAEIDPNELSREEAERILQALENEEGQLLRQVQKMKVRARRVEKDW